MINGKKVLAVITARGGSKGLPGKNIRPLGGRPLIAWSIWAAKESQVVDRVIVSTDDPAIAEAARAAGGEVPFMRPEELARDDTPSEPVVLHALAELEEGYDYVVLLQPTSPFRRAEDIDNAVRLCQQMRAAACVAVSLAKQSPWWTFTLDEESRLSRILPEIPGRRRQDMPKVYYPNGAVFVAEAARFRAQPTFYPEDIVGYPMPPERALDIDTKLDFLIAETMLREGLA
jgi:CMP-N,N'-diacetyllegionaminic acid synthase